MNRIKPMESERAEYARSVGLDPHRLPNHVAIIMDGNGRWAQQRGQRRVEGHSHGVTSVRTTIEECCRLGLSQLTLYCLSSENWKRPREELDFLLALLQEYLVSEREMLSRENIRFHVIGHRDGLGEAVLEEIRLNEELTRNNSGMGLCLAINYGARQEILDACKRLASQVARGELSIGSIDEAAMSGALETAGMPDPDLLIRTAGEMRVSNFLLWQISYAEIWVTPCRWPEFDIGTLHMALRDYAGRERRFGGLAAPGGVA